MLYEHLRQTKDEAVFRITKDYEKDTANYDEIEKMARMMAKGFPRNNHAIPRQIPPKTFLAKNVKKNSNMEDTMV